MKHVHLNLFLICLSLIFTERFCRSQTHGFCLSKVSSHHVYPFQALEEPVPSSLNQPFYYLGSGVQCYAFLGEDKKTVLKLFKHHHMGFSTDLIKKILPNKMAASIVKKREKRMVHLLESAQIAHDVLGQETGVFYAHLTKTNHELGQVSLYDNINLCHTLDLDQTEFVLQKKAEPAQQMLHRLFKENRIDDAIDAMKHLLSMIENRSKKGIKKKDGKIIVNCGFKKGRPIEIDIGSYVFRSASTNPDPHRSARIKGAMQLLEWIKQDHPEHLQTCKKRLLDEDLL